MAQPSLHCYLTLISSHGVFSFLSLFLCLSPQTSPPSSFYHFTPALFFCLGLSFPQPPLCCSLASFLAFLPLSHRSFCSPTVSLIVSPRCIPPPGSHAPYNANPHIGCSTMSVCVPPQPRFSPPPRSPQSPSLFCPSLIFIAVTGALL